MIHIPAYFITFSKSYPVEYMTYTTYTLICAVFIFVMHRDNVSRLVSGTERKLGKDAGHEETNANKPEKSVASTFH